MSTLVSDIQLRLAYRLRENSAPNEVNEKARRFSFISEGNRKILGEKYWWFLRTIGSDTTVADQEIYTLTGVRDLVELRVDNKVYAPISDKEAFGSTSYPPNSYYYGSNSPRYFVYNDELHLIPVVSSTPTTFTVSSITQTGGVATVTTSTAHGYTVNTYVTIAGATPAAYSGTFRVTSIPSTVTFTVTVPAATSSPASGSMSVKERNIVYRYWSKVVPLVDDASVIQIPDDYSDILVAYSFMRMQQVMGRRGSAADGVEEYNQLSRDMIAEENRRKFKNKNYQPPYGEYV